MASLERPDGTDLHYEERADGPLVMIAPYWSGHPGVYAGFLSDLEHDHRVVTWDARGTGESTRSGPYDVETDCDDLEAMLDHVGPAAAVIGVGNGCNIVVHVAARRPDLVGAALAFGAGPFTRTDFAGSEAMIASDSVVAAFLEMLQRDYRGALRTVLTATNNQMSEEEIRDRVDFQSSYCLQEAAIARVQAWAEDDPTQSAATIGSRLWIFSSGTAAGPWLPPLADRQRIIQRITPDAHSQEMADDAGPVSRPDLVAAAIRRITEPLRIESGR
jgi:pimeloyl-ACP methyl ester carboxylesterase